MGTPYCDTLLEQAIPISKLSTNYLLTASQGSQLASTSSDLVRVVATVDGTSVSVDGGAAVVLNRGQVHEFSLPTNNGARVNASQPVLVAQYLKGGQGANTDPAMSYVPGQDTWLAEYRLATPSGASAFQVNYASIAMLTADLPSLMLDGAPVNTSGFTSIAGTAYSRGNVALPLGLFDLTGGSEFLVMLGGGAGADSYFTYGGSTFAPGISPPPPPPPPTGVPAPAPLLLLAAAALASRVTARRKQQP